MNRADILKNDTAPPVEEWKPELGEIVLHENGYEYYIERLHTVECMHRETFHVYDIVSVNKKVNQNGIREEQFMKQFKPTGRKLPPGKFDTRPIE